MGVVDSSHGDPARVDVRSQVDIERLARQLLAVAAVAPEPAPLTEAAKVLLAWAKQIAAEASEVSRRTAASN